MNSVFSQLIMKIIGEQENIIGPLAVEQAKKIKGLKIDWLERKIVITGDEKKIVKNLISQYEKIFGQASVEVCLGVINSMKIDLAT
ncbi:hypothetical protein HZA76_05000 [Candidatus Roizmanbacteria bacterium]|nr:hypothetical protein [Candidatus Roizmanbacteria bacterium]